MASSQKNQKESMLHFYIKNYIKLNDEFKANGSDSHFFNICALFFYLSHLISYIMFYELESKNDEEFHTFTTLIYYLNFTNLIIFTNDKTITIIIYCLLLFLALFISFYIPFSFLCKRLFKFNILNKKSFFFTNKAIVFCIYNFYWILFHPSLDLFLKLISCQNKNFTCYEENFWMNFISITSIILIILNGLAHLILNENYLFNDKSSLNMKFTISQFVLYGLRISIVFLAVSKNEMKIYVHLCTHIFLLLSLAEFLKTFPFRNPFYNKFYLALVTSYEALSILISSSNYIFILDSKSNFITFCIMSIITFKLSEKMYDLKQNNFYFNLEKDKLINKDYFLEEILFLSDKENSSESFYFILAGKLKKISKIKDNKNIEIKNSIIKNMYHNFSSEDRKRIISTYVEENFNDAIQSRIKHKHDNKEKEKLSIKYISFLLMKNTTTIFRILFEFLKIQSSINNTSYLYKIRSELAFEKIKLRIDKIEAEKKYSAKNSNEEEAKIYSSDFFLQHKKTILLEKKTKSALEGKIDFYENFYNGFDNYEVVLNTLDSSIQKIQSFQRFLFKEEMQGIVKLKFQSVLNSVLINFMPLAINNEEEVEKIRKKFYKHEKEKLTPNIFLTSSNLVIQVSFLNDNKILESSKSERLAKFFGFNPTEFNSINNLNTLMPKFISENHRSFVLNSLDRKSKIKDNISVLAIDKGGFCFPIQIFFAQAFEYHNDFVLNALLRKSISIHNHIILTDSNGVISNTSKETFELLKYHINNLSPNDLGFFKIKQLIPDLKILLTEESFNQENFKLKNHESYMLIPQHAEEILNILRLKSQFIFFDHTSRRQSIQSFQSFESLNIENKKRGNEQLIKKCISEESLLSKYFNCSLVSSWIKNNGISCHDLLDYFYEGLQSKQINIIFDMEIKTVYLDETNGRKNSIKFIELLLTKIENTLYEPVKDSAIISESKIHIDGLPSHHYPEINLLFGPMKNTESKIKKKQNHTAGDDIGNLAPKKILLEGENKKKQNIIFKKEYLESFTNDKEETTNVKKDSTHRESSVFGRINQSFSLIKIQKDLLKATPSAIYFMYSLFFIQTFLIVVFAFLLFIASFNFEKFFFPLNQAMNEQTKLNIAFRYGSTMMSFNELEFNGFIKRDEFILKKQNEILINSTLNVQESLKFLKTSDRNFNFENNLKTLMTKFFDLRTNKMKTILFTDLMDFLLEELNLISKLTYSNDTADRKSFARNLPYYMDSSRDNRDLVQKELLISNTLVSSQFINVVVVFCIILALIKVFELFSFLKINKNLIQLINILFRISRNESNKEYSFLMGLLSIIENSSSSFMTISFTDFLLKKEKFTEKREELENSKSKSANTKNKKRKLVSLNMGSFSKKRLFLYMTLSFLIVFLYYIMNFIQLKEVENKVGDLIRLNIMINNLNLYSGNIACLSFYQIRDKLLNEIEYNNLKEDLQNVDLRQKYFYGRFTGRLSEVKSYAHQIPNLFTEARQDLGKNFEQLVNGNACKSLIEFSEIDLAFYEFCTKSFNGGFTKGIIGATNEFLKYVNELDQYVKPRNSSMIQKDNIKILNFLRYSDSKNIIMDTYLLSKSLKIFRNVMNDYYTDILNENLIKLKIITFASSAITLIFFLIISYIWIIRIRSSYKICVLGLSLIPYEKISNDEQTIFLIKKFHKENLMQ